MELNTQMRVSKWQINPIKHSKIPLFLKRAYRYDAEVGKEIILPKIEESTISEIINWYRDTEDLEPQLQANMKAALGFAFFYGREYYDTLNKKYCEAMRKHDMHPLCITFDEQLDRFLAMVHGDEDGNYENFIELGY